MSLGVTSMLMAVIAVVSVVIVSALKQNRWPDYIAVAVAVIGISVPLFVMGPVLQLIFGMKLKILPIGQWISTHGIKAMILPAVTLSFPYFAYIARLSRASILEVLRSDYIRTARAKGLKESVVVWKHVLKGAMLPVVTYLGPAFSGIVVGSVVVESVFLVPGIGRPFVQSALNRDYTLIMAEVVVYSVILIIANLVVDLVYGLLDPRISYK
jgi:oligopeptide transport system permease protein